jgi:hypothetical protein
MILFSIIFNIIILNLFIGSYIHKKEKYSMYNCPKWFGYLYTALGCLTLLFKKRFDEYKKYYYIKNKVIYYETLLMLSSSNLLTDDESIDYNNYKRYLKIKHIQNKK